MEKAVEAEGAVRSAVQEETPFFIVGAQRSGTTMLRLMLNAHPRLAIPFESAFLGAYETLGDRALDSPAAAAHALELLAEDPWTKKGGIIADRERVLAHPIRSYADLLRAVFGEYARGRGKPRWGIKTPGYVEHLDALWKLFPGCLIVHIVRDGRDVALSLKRVSWGSSHIPRVAEDWKWKTLLGRKMGAMIGEHYLEVRYEDLVRAPEPVLRRICAFLGEDYDPAMLEYHRDARAEMPEQSLRWHRSSVSRPDPNKVFAWKREMPVVDQMLFEDIAGAALETFGYERLRRAPTLASRLRRVYYAAVKRW